MSPMKLPNPVYSCWYNAFTSFMTTGIPTASHLSIAYRYTQSPVKLVRRCAAPLNIAVWRYTANPHPAHILIQGHDPCSQLLPPRSQGNCKGCLQTWGGWLILMSKDGLKWPKPDRFRWLETQKEVLAAMPVGFASWAPKTQEWQWCKGQHEARDQVKLSPLDPHWDTCNVSDAIPQSWTGRTHEQQITWKIQHQMTTRKGFLICFLSFQIWQFQSEGTGTLQMQRSVLCVLSIRKMSVNWGECRNHQETTTDLAEQASKQKNLNGFRQVGIESMAKQWASVAANAMTAETCFPECKREDGYHIYIMAQRKTASHIQVKLEEKV